MRLRILMSLLVIGAVTALMGFTIAQFSDTETSTGNTISTTSLNLQMGTTPGGVGNCTYDDPFDGPLFTFANAAPGGSQEVTICLMNDSTLNGEINATLSVASDVEVGACNEQEALVDSSCGNGDAGELAANTNLHIWADLDCNNTFDGGDFSLFDGLASGLPAIVGPANYGPGEEACTGVLATILLAAGNEVQTDLLSLDVDVTLTQVP